MTTYTTTAIATNSVTNTVTVASISNMVSGMPITFSGPTFGGITTAGTYYIGTIVYGYPTSSITLTSLPGGAVFALATATGSMTAHWASGGQQMVITTPPGEGLNLSFTKINTNFDQIWASGPVGSNVRISGDTISTLDTNGNLVLNPNGTGNIVANAHVIPDTTRIRNLGSPTHYWDTIYVEYGEIGNLNISQVTIPVSNLHILGGNANNLLQTDGTGNLRWITQLPISGGANTEIQYNNNGLIDGSPGFTFENSSNTVTIPNLVTTGQANLNSVSNVFISGGTPGYVLQTDGHGNLNWVSPTGNTQIILDQQITGDNTSYSYGLITSPSANSIIVAINGVQQLPRVAYTVSGNTITFAEPLLSSEVADIRFLAGGPAGNGQPGGSNGTIQFNNGAGLGGSPNLSYNEITGNLYSANVSVGGNVTAGYYHGDGSQLTGVTALADTGTITFDNNIISTSNANAVVNILAPQQTPVSMAAGGNSATAQLLWATNIGALTPAQLNNGVLNSNTWGTQISVGNAGAVISSNSVVGLKTWTFRTDGTLSSTGSITAGDINISGNLSATGTVTANVDLSATGNVSGTYILGNLAFANGIPALYSNASVDNHLNGSAANIIPLANVSYSLGNATNQWKDLWVANSTIYMNSVPIALATGNVLTVAGNAVITADSLGNVGFVGNTIYDVNGISIQNSDLSHGLTAAVTIPANGDANAIVLNNTYGNVILQTGSSSNTTAAWIFSNNGNLSLPGGGLLGNTYGDNPNAVGLQAGSGGYAGINSHDRSQFVQADATGVHIGTNYIGNSCLWTFNASGNLVLPGNSSSINYANGQPYGGNSGNTFDQSLNTTDSVTFVDISATGNITTANGNISGADYITGNFFVGDGGRLSNISVTANTGNVSFNNSTVVGPSFGVVPSANSSVYIQPTVDAATVYQFSGATLSVPGAVSAAGNVAAANFIGNGNTLSNVATQVTGSWTLAPGTNTVSFTVLPGYSYTMWVNGNIPNGIVLWNATVTTSNTNVPVTGVQYGWYYAGGNALVLTAIPNQIVGTAGGISTAIVATTTSNVFTFGITNNSIAAQVVNWGYTRL